MGPHPQDTRSPETPPSFGGAGVGSAAGDSPGSGDGGHRQRGTGRPGPGVLPAGTACPASSAPSRGDPSLLRPQGCDTSPSAQGLRGQGQRFFCLFLPLPVFFQLEFIGELQRRGIFFFFFGVQKLSSFMVLLSCFSHTRLCGTP